MEDEIDQADIFNERVHRAIIDATSAIETKRSENDTVPTPVTVKPTTAVFCTPLLV